MAGEIYDEGKSWPQILAIFLACLPSFTCGLLFSWSSPSILAIIKDQQTYNINEEQASYFAVIPPVAMIISSLLFFNLNDRFGRKFTLLLVAIPHIFSWILIALSKSVYVFYLSRFLTGVGDAWVYTTVPVYIGEITTPKVRTAWGNATSFSIYFGQFFINIIGSYLSVSKTGWVCLVFPFIFIISFSFMPESPYFLIMKNKDEAARKSLQFLRRKQNVDLELVDLKADVARQMSESGTWRDLVMIQSNRKAIYVGAFLRASQQLGGISSFSVYIQLIFDKAGGDVSPQISAIIFTGICCVLNLCASFTLERIGRQKSYLYSLILSGIVLLVEGAYFYIDQFEDSIDVQFLNWIPITGLLLFCVFYSLGLGIVPTLMLGELFSASVKGKGLCLMIVIYALLISVMTKLFQVLQASVGLFCPFFVFAASCFGSAVLALYLVPETKGKTLEEIQQEFKKSESD